MTQFAQKTFTVPGPKNVDTRRDCAQLGHWPVFQKGTLKCWFCGVECATDGTTAPKETIG